MFVKRLLQKAILDVPITTGNLKALQLCPHLAWHHGIPYTASVLAYEPVQRLLAVASSDGRIKILGAVGVEALLQSPTQFPCKYLEFLNNRGLLVHVNTQNDIEVWDVEKRELVYFQKWEGDITSFVVLQGSPYMFVGEHSGTVTVLQYVDQEQKLNVMPYAIPACITLGGLVRSGSSEAPPVIGVLPQPDVFFTRLLLAYVNGLIVLWGLHEGQVLAVRGGTEGQHIELANHAARLKGRAVYSSQEPPQVADDEEEDKEICCVCWACPFGSVLAVGYIDGEILLWSFPTIIKGTSQMETEFVEEPMYSREPIHRLDLAPETAKMPVVSLIWGASARSSRGVGGRLYVFGGGDVARPGILTVLSLDALVRQENAVKLVRCELSLPGPFADMALLPPPGGSLSTPAAAFVLLMIPGLVHIYDELNIANYFAAIAEGMPSPSFLQPVPLQLPVTETKVTCAKLVLVSNHGMAAKVLLQLPQTWRSLVPSTWPAGTKWPITGGTIFAPASGHAGNECLYITGHENGLLKIWDESSHSYSPLCTVEPQTTLTPSEKKSVSAFDFCASSGLLAIGDGNGKVSVYKLEKEACEVKCRIIGLGTSHVKEELLNFEPGFGCILVQNSHTSAICTISIASGVARVAIGDEGGMVSLLDLESLSIIFYECCFPNNPSPILSLAFSPESLSSEGTPTALSPRSPSKHKPTQIPLAYLPVLYVVGKDASMVAYDASTGVIFGSGAMQPKHPSTAISLHLLDGGGAPVAPLNIPLGEIPETRTQRGQLNPSSSTTEDESSCYVQYEEQGSEWPAFGASSEALLLLLCCTDSLRLYATSAVIQGLRTTLRKVKLEKACCWTSTFIMKGDGASGLILMSGTGELEFRSLPDLGLLKEISLSSSVDWTIQPTVDSVRTMACNTYGQLVMIDRETELIHISVAADDITREQCALSQLYDKDLARAADVAITYARNASNRKGLLGGVLKELKNVLDIEHPQVIHAASELPKLFSSCPFAAAMTDPSSSVHHDALSSSVSLESTTLQIDDLDVEDTDADLAQLPPVENPSGKKFARKLSVAIKSLKGKGRSDEAQSSRQELFDGSSETKPSKARTVDDIRAKYGHPRKSQEVKQVSNVMEMARNKLAERGEKLQDISDKTAELEDNAQNFASMAEELAKRMANKKWWEL